MAEKDMTITEKAQYIENNGNGKSKKGQLLNSESMLHVDDDLKKALLAGESTNEVNEPTKYILLNDAFVNSVNDDRVRHFTKLLDRDEVLQMNDIERHADLIPLVFGSLRGLATKAQRDYRIEFLKNARRLFLVHTHDHMDNMMALDVKGGNLAKLLVMALRSDTNPMPNDKDVKRMFGGKN
jgi:hypothetical protein